MPDKQTCGLARDVRTTTLELKIVRLNFPTISNVSVRQAENSLGYDIELHFIGPSGDLQGP